MYICTSLGATRAHTDKKGKESKSGMKHKKVERISNLNFGTFLENVLILLFNTQ